MGVFVFLRGNKNQHNLLTTNQLYTQYTLSTSQKSRNSKLIVFVNLKQMIYFYIN